MKSEPLYGLPVEEPGDVEGWSINAGQPGPLLADAIAAEADRIESDITAFQAAIDALPRIWQAGSVNLPFTVFTVVPSGFYNQNYWRGSEAVVFRRPFESPPAVVLLPNNASIPGFSIEASVTDVTTAGFTANLAVAGSFTGTFVNRWLAASRTQ